MLSKMLRGDFNARDKSWNGDKTDHSGRQLDDTFLKYGHTVLNMNIGTRPGLYKDANHLLDLITANFPAQPCSFSTLAPISDHIPVFLTLPIEKIVQAKQR